jgi:hypothetical protein
MSPKKITSSKLTNQQLQQLAHQVLNAADQRLIDNWMERMAMPNCAPDWFRQDIINHITTRAGREPDEIVRGMDAKRQRDAEAKARQEAAGPAQPVVNIIDLGKPAAGEQNPNTLVAHPCLGGCNTRLAVTIAEVKAQGAALYCAPCLDKAKKMQAHADAEAEKFLTTAGTGYYNCAYNNEQVLNWLLRNKKACTFENLTDACLALRSTLLPTLTIEQVRNMLPEEFNLRAKLEGSDVTGIMGGVDLKTLTTAKPEATIHSSNKIRTSELPPLDLAKGRGIRGAD